MKDSKAYIDKIAPEHLSTKVLSGALYIHNGKDADEKINRTEQVLNKIGTELASYAMASFLPPDRKSTRLNSSHLKLSRMPSSA